MSVVRSLKRNPTLSLASLILTGLALALEVYLLRNFLNRPNALTTLIFTRVLPTRWGANNTIFWVIDALVTVLPLSSLGVLAAATLTAINVPHERTIVFVCATFWVAVNVSLVYQIISIWPMHPGHRYVYLFGLAECCLSSLGMIISSWLFTTAYWKA